MRRKIARKLHRLAFRLDTPDFMRAPTIRIDTRLILDDTEVTDALTRIVKRSRAKRKRQEGQDGTD